MRKESKMGYHEHDPLVEEGPAEHIRNALAVLMARKQMSIAVWNEAYRVGPDEERMGTPAIFLRINDVDAIIERLKSALATL